MMHILYCGDRKIADGVLLSALSIARTVREPFAIHILTADVRVGSVHCTRLPDAFSTVLTNALADVLPGCSVRIRDMTDAFEKDPPLANLETRFTPCCMLRLYADLDPELPDRVLYLDNDVLCRTDPTAFYTQDLDGCPLAGVLDFYGSHFFRKNLFRRDYLNSGVLLLDLAKIRETGLFAACREMCRTKEMFMPDQSAINKLAECKKICPRRYNEQRKLQKDTVFQHFTTSFRLLPWFHAVSVKPWNTEAMHSVLKLHEYDSLLDQYQQLKENDHACF